MKYAICNELYENQTFESTCEDIRRVGYTGIEIAPYTLAADPQKLSEGEIERFGRSAAEAGLEVVGLHWLLAKPDGFCLTSPDAELRERTVSFLCHLVNVCRGLGGSIMVFGSPKQRVVQPDQKYSDAFDWAAEGLRTVSEEAAKAGVTIAVEPLSPVECNFLTSAAKACKLIEAVDHPACRLHLDVKAMSSEDQPIEQIITEHKDQFAHFHVNDPNLGGPGSGDVDFVPILRAIQEVGYEGFLSVEVFDYSLGAETIARQSIEYLEKIQQEVEIDTD